MAGVRTYNPSCRVGNWNEDLFLEEDLLKDFIDRKQNGGLSIEKTQQFLSQILTPAELTAGAGGLRFGDAVAVYNPMKQVCLAINIATDGGACAVTGTQILQPCVRNTLVITACEEGRDGQPLMYGDHFMLCSSAGLCEMSLKIKSEAPTFTQCAKKSRLQEVYATENSNYDTHWQIVHKDPQLRLEAEGTPVAGDSTVLVNHCKTNNRLRVMSGLHVRTSLGYESEIVTDTDLDSHKAEREENHWVIVTGAAE